MKKLKEWLYRFMYGRYGSDQLNITLVFAALIVNFAAILLNSTWLVVLCDVLIICAVYRMLSRNIVKRSLENRKFTDRTAGIRRRWKAFNMTRKDKENRYSVCPKCKQIVRYPRHRGNIEVICPKCSTTFVRRS